MKISNSFENEIQGTSQISGLFGFINGGNVKNLGVENAVLNVADSGNTTYAGVIVGY